MVSLRNTIKLILITVFLSTSTIYADSSNSKRNSIVRSSNGNILAEILEIVYSLGVDFGTAIKIYFKGN